MADIITLVSGSEVKVQPLNDNFSELESRITATNESLETTRSNVNSSLINMQNFLEASISTQISALINNVSSSIEALDDFMGRLDKHINYSVPAGKIALIDWQKMSEKSGASVQTLKTGINNTEYGTHGYYRTTNDLLNKGDLYFKEDFTNYPRILIVWVDANSSSTGSHINSKVWETWELDFLLGSSKGMVSLIDSAGSNKGGSDECHFYNVYGYSYGGGSIVSTTKKYFGVFGNRNAGITEIYGLVNDIVDTYIRPNTDAFSQSWLSESDEENAEALTPQVGVIYKVKTDGTYKNKTYRWDTADAQYKEVTIE